MVKVIKKDIELIELFYDLIFVYAISQLTALINEPIGGIISPNNFFVYIITSFVILQAWLYFTNYVNRYGQWKWHEYVLACINMIAVIFMTNTISTEWESMLLPFNVAMLIMLLTVVVLYSVHAYNEKIIERSRRKFHIYPVNCLFNIYHSDFSNRVRFFKHRHLA